MSRSNLIAWCITISLSLVLDIMSASAGAVDVWQESRSLAREVQDARQDIIDTEQAEQDRLQARQYVASTKWSLEAAEEYLKQAIRQADEKLSEAKQLAVDAEALNAEAKQADLIRNDLWAKAAKAYQEAEQAQANAQQREAWALAAVRNISASAAANLSAADAQNVSEFELMEIAQQGMKAVEQAEQAADAEIEAVWDKVNYLYAIADAANYKADTADWIADQKEEAADALQDKAEQAMDRALDAREVADDAAIDLEDYKNDLLEAEADLAALLYEQQHPRPLYYFSQELNYYHWSNNNGSGYQWVQPLNVGYWSKDISYGLNVNYVRSHNNTPGSQGSVNAFTDTGLFAVKRRETTRHLFEYGLAVNIPTGKERLSFRQRNAMMNEDLVEVGQFGEGWKFTPSFAVSRKIGKEDKWTLGTSYAFRGSYDPTSYLDNDTISPGNEWRKFLRWQHAGRQWQFIGELIHTTNEVTTVKNGSRFNEGNHWEGRLVYNRLLPQDQSLMYYYFYKRKSPDLLVLNDVREGPAHYLGTMWTKPLTDKRSLRISFDVMRATGNHYDGLLNRFDEEGLPDSNSVYVDGRTKYTLGIGYDIQLTPQSSYSIDLQKFIMKDGASSQGESRKTVRGANILLKYNRSF